MSEENVEIVRRGYEVFNATGDIEPEAYTPDFEFRDFEDSPQPMRRGIEQWRAWARDVHEAFDQFRLEPEELIDLGDQVFAVIRFRGSGRASGAAMEQPFFVLWTLHEGRIAGCSVFRDKSQALEAAGLSE